MLLLSIAIIAFAVLLVVEVYLKRVWFYRDPIRHVPQDPKTILSPADGKLIYQIPFQNGRVSSTKLGCDINLEEITKAKMGEQQDGWILGIYMSPLDVHYNYAPIDGVVTDVIYTRAKLNLPMVDLWEYINLTYFRKAVNLFARKHHLHNERNTIFIQGEGIRVAVVEIADKFVNKIQCFVKPGQRVTRGQKLSFIGRGSQVDLVIFKPDASITVPNGIQVYGSSTILAKY